MLIDFRLFGVGELVVFEFSCDNCNVYFVIEGVVDDCVEDDVGFVMGSSFNEIGCVGNFK